MTKKLYIKTYGCQMNVYDSARMAETLAPLGYAPADSADDADMVILNTCHIREKAAEKVYSELGRLNGLRRRRAAQGKRLMVTVAGCVAQAEGAEMLRRAPFVDLVVGPQSYQNLPEMIARAEKTRHPVMDIDFPALPKFDLLDNARRLAPGHHGPGASSAFLTVQEGCDKFCSFCVVPYTRGVEYSRGLADVVAEARGLAAAGAVEITLLGQNVNAYHGLDAEARERGLGHLIRAVAEIDGIARIRYTTSHPLDMDGALIAAHAEVLALMPFIHLPVQSGSDRVLAAMNRRHRAGDYRRIVERLRGARSDIALSSDFIVGFPGETEADFDQTMALVRDIGFVQAYSFKFSPRPGTPAADLAGQVPDDEKAGRLAALQDLLNDQQLAFNRACVGCEMAVLFDRPGRHAGQLVGRSPFMQPVHATVPEAAMGSLQRLRITAAHANSLAGEPVAAFGRQGERIPA